MDVADPPAPAPDAESAFYWAALARGELHLQRCEDCGRARFPAMPGCPYCGGARAQVVHSPGLGRVYSWVTVHRALDPRWSGEVPYSVAVVELDEGCRVLGRWADETSPPSVELRARAQFVRQAGWTELRFAAEPEVTRP